MESVRLGRASEELVSELSERRLLDSEGKGTMSSILSPTVNNKRQHEEKVRFNNQPLQLNCSTALLGEQIFLVYIFSQTFTGNI